MIAYVKMDNDLGALSLGACIRKAVKIGNESGKPFHYLFACKPEVPAHARHSNDREIVGVIVVEKD